MAAVLLLTGCSALPAPPARPVLYDFGPGPLATVPTDRRAPLPPLAMADMDAPGLPEGGNAVLYRLAYADAQQLLGVGIGQAVQHGVPPLGQAGGIHIGHRQRRQGRTAVGRHGGQRAGAKVIQHGAGRRRWQGRAAREQQHRRQATAPQRCSAR